MTDRVKDKVVIVTGGVSGLGLAGATRLAEEGARLIVTDIQDDLSNAALERIRDYDPEALYLHLDVADEAQWKAVTDQVMAQHGRLDGLVNNAGMGSLSVPIHETDLTAWRRLMAVNLDGVFLGVKHGIRAMLATGSHGSIVNNSSIMGLVGAPNSGAYAASKGGIRLLTKVAALECAGDGIRVNSLHPGFVETPMLAAGIKRTDGALKNHIEAATPTGQMGRPEDIAEGMVFLISDESRFMTGSELVIDGGYTAR
jgi:NAD(P)-dependent dehydrogenase (short-subunit alcohol dehydrogenase family)